MARFEGEPEPLVSDVAPRRVRRLAPIHRPRTAPPRREASCPRQAESCRPLEGTAPTADSPDVDRDPYSLIGKYVLVGITRIDAAGSLLEEGERHGRITSVDDHAGIKVTLSDGEILTLPPNPDAFRDAKPGIYRLRSTGEEIVDPDLTTVWTIREPPADRN
jgi:hypothetical protein